MASKKRKVPDERTRAIWRERGRARAVDGCLLPGLHGTCRHGKPSWLDDAQPKSKGAA